MPDTCTLLIVDDCAEDRETCRRFLLKDPFQNYQILEAESAEGGLLLFQEMQCDAILLDFCLPTMSGLEFLDELKRCRLDLPPVIMMTAHGAEEIAVQAMKRGAQDYLIKSRLQPDLLQGTVRSALQDWRLQNQLHKVQERQRMVTSIALQMRQSLNLEQILQTATTALQQLLECDRMTVYQFTQTSEHSPHSPKSELSQPFLTKVCGSGSGGLREPLQQFLAFLTDAEVSSSEPDRADSRNGVQSADKTAGKIPIAAFRHKSQDYLLAQIPLAEPVAEPVVERGDRSPNIWGLLVAGRTADRQWQPDEIELFGELSGQLAIAIHHAEQLAQVTAALELEKQLNLLQSQIVATVSHEYRAPLTAILAAASTLKLHGTQLEVAQQQRFLEIIEAKARHMARLVEDLLVLKTFESGKTEFKPMPFSLLQFFADVLEEQRQSLNDRHDLIFTVAGNTKGFWGDQGLLQQILVNLLSNAAKYSADGTPIEVSLTGNESHVSFAIRDQGIGIPKDEQNGVLQAFDRASNAGEIPGTGLGLAIVKACVNLHKGEIQIESQEGEGTTVTIHLPKRSSEHPLASSLETTD